MNEPDVVFETFDEEIVAVNLETGTYYSISGSGPNIWMDVAFGASLDEIVDELSVSYTGERNAIVFASTVFVDRLVSELLLVEDAGDAPRNRLVGKPAMIGEKRPFEAPVIENYSDMQDLLMLDPIHDVDPAGWPVAKTNP